jgi:hypothetical protein
VAWYKVLFLTRHLSLVDVHVMVTAMSAVLRLSSPTSLQCTIDVEVINDNEADCGTKLFRVGLILHVIGETWKAVNSFNSERMHRYCETDPNGVALGTTL